MHQSLRGAEIFRDFEVGGAQVTGKAELRGMVEAWIADDPDARDRAELCKGCLTGPTRPLAGRVTHMRRRSRSCGTGLRGGWSSGRPGCGGW